MPFVQQQGNLGPKIKGYADVVFLIDSTGSMGDIIDGIKSNVQQFVDGLQSNPQNSLDWNVWVVGFRDIEADSLEYAFINLEKGFVNSVEDVVQQLNGLEAAGGGDEPESLLDALLAIASANKWPRQDNQSQRVIAIFTDAPPKTELHPSTTTGDRSVHRVVKELTKQRVKLFIYGPSDNEILKTLTNAHPTKSIYFPLGNTYEEVTQTLKTQGFDDVLKQMGSTLSAGGDINVLDAGSQAGIST